MSKIMGERPKALVDVPLHYCPGCTHGIVHRLVAEVIDELGIEGKTVGVASVGCSVFTYNYFGCDMVQAPHGRALFRSPREARISSRVWSSTYARPRSMSCSAHS